MFALQSTSLQRKSDLQPSTSFDSAQTAQTQQHGASPDSPAYAGGVGSSKMSAWQPACSLLAPQDGIVRPIVDPSAAKLAIKEALAPLGPAQLAMVQEQLRQSRLARQQEAWGCASVVPEQCCSPCLVPSTTEQEDSRVNPLVQHVASALAHGKVSPQDISRVLSGLDPSVFLPVPQKQLQLPQLCPPQLWPPQLHNPPQFQPQHVQDRPAWAARASSAPSMVSVPAAIPMPPSPFYSSQLPAALPSAHQRQPYRAGPRPSQRSVAGPYSAVLNSLQLPASALAAHAAAATAADAAAARMRHPGDSVRKGRRSSRRARGQVIGLLRSVSTASDAAGQTSLTGAAEPDLCQQQQQQQAAGNLLYMCMAASAAPASDAHMHGSSWAGASAVSLSDVALTCRETTADAGRPAAPAAVPAECAEQGVEATAAAAPTSLRARFARLPPRVQEDILRKLDELSAMEDEMRGVRDAELQGGPRRSNRARKVRNLDESNSLAAKGGVRSASPTPPPCELDDLQQQEGRVVHKRMRLDAGSLQDAQGSKSPEAPSRPQQQQQGNSSPEVQMPPALDLMWVCPEPIKPFDDQLPRKRRIARKVGARASARKRMHRATFRRGKPQRAPTA